MLRETLCEARGDLLGNQGLPKLHKIITHNVTNDTEAIRSVHDRFGRHQKNLEGTKTIVDTSNRFRVVGDVVCDDFMQFGRLLGAERVPARLAAPHEASPSFRSRGHGEPAARRRGGLHFAIFFYHWILRPKKCHFGFQAPGS